MYLRGGKYDEGMGGIFLKTSKSDVRERSNGKSSCKFFSLEVPMLIWPHNCIFQPNNYFCLQLQSQDALESAVSIILRTVNQIQKADSLSLFLKSKRTRLETSDCRLKLQGKNALICKLIFEMKFRFTVWIHLHMNKLTIPVIFLDSHLHSLVLTITYTCPLHLTDDVCHRITNSQSAIAREKHRFTRKRNPCLCVRAADLSCPLNDPA